MEKLFAENRFERVIHLAAQAGVRYSLENPHAYVQSNVVGFLNVLECCRRQWTGGEEAQKLRSSEAEKKVGGFISVSELLSLSASRHLVYASSSSVYGSNTKLPFSTKDNVDHPISMYAATKKADELMAYTYSHLYGIPTTGLRFFTVYGPWGRPDMAYFKFTKAIAEGRPIDVYNNGKMRRDFTYIDDIVEGVLRVADRIPSSCALSPAPYALYNIGNHSPVDLLDFIKAIESALGKEAKINFKPMQPGDVLATFADVGDLMRDVGFKPDTPIHEGIGRFVDWYKSYYLSS